jgi:hypothetical protein
MSSTIKTYDDFLEEKERVKNLLALHKQRVVTHWEEVKMEFTPVTNAFGVIGKMAKPDKTNPLLNTGLKIASEVFLTNFVLAKAGWIAKLAIPFVMKNYSSHMLAEKGKVLLDKLGGLFKHRKNGQEVTP